MNAVFLLVTLDLDLEAKGAGSLEHTRQRTAHRQTRANRHGWVDRRAQVVEHLSSRPRCCAPECKQHSRQIADARDSEQHGCKFDDREVEKFDSRKIEKCHDTFLSALRSHSFKSSR